MLEYHDFQLAYNNQNVRHGDYQPYPGPDPPSPGVCADPANAIAPPNNGVQPSIISGAPEPGGRSLNYRSEPIPFRVGAGKPIQFPVQVNQDLAHAFRSIPRQDPDLNLQPVGPIKPGSSVHFPGPFAGAGPTDPYTPLLRVYENDRVHIRVLVGAHHEGNVFNMHGLKWQTEPDETNSGFRSNQVMSISEHFEFNFTVPPATVNQPPPGSYRARLDRLPLPGQH